MYQYDFLGTIAYSNAHYGQGNGPVHIGSVICGGSEENLLSCSYNAQPSCASHSKDAGVRCSG